MKTVRRTWLLLLLLVSLAAAATAGPALGGGWPTEVYFVASDGTASAIGLDDRAAEALSAGRQAAAPDSEYVALYPVFFGLPGAPLLYFPEQRTLCGGWDSDRSCRRATPAARRVLREAATTGRRSAGEPTTIAGMRVRGEPVRLPNAWVGLELALAQDPLPAAPSQPGLAVELRWRGPDAAARPARVVLYDSGVVAGGRQFDVLPGVTTYLSANAGPLEPERQTASPAGARGGRQAGAILTAAIALALGATVAGGMLLSRRPRQA